jgi:hypothetical protein
MQKDEDFWNEAYIIADYIFQTNLSYKEIAKKMNANEGYIIGIVKELGIEWVRRKNRKLSRGASALTGIMKSLMPGSNIINEYHVGERLMVDVYSPEFKLGAEYHGRQHFFYSTLFHENKRDFVAGQQRDKRKLELCEEQGITLVSFRYNDILTEDIVYERIVDALRKESSPLPLVPKKRKIKKTPYYEEMQKRQRSYKRAEYKRLKELNKRDFDKPV